MDNFALTHLSPMLGPKARRFVRISVVDVMVGDGGVEVQNLWTPKKRNLPTGATLGDGNYPVRFRME